MVVRKGEIRTVQATLVQFFNFKCTQKYEFENACSEK